MSIVYFRFAARVPERPARAPLLERLLARADDTVHIIDWRAHAWPLLAPGLERPAVATAARAASIAGATATPGASGTSEASGASDASAASAWLFLATPVHLIAGLHGVHLAANGLLELTALEADALAAAFNTFWGDSGARLLRGRGTRLLCALDPTRLGVRATAVPVTRDPEELLGRDIRESLPQGPGAPAVRRLMSELEMWLHEHEVNAARRARTEPEIVGLWLWGGASADRALPSLELWSAGDDALFGAYRPVTRYPGAATPGMLTSPTCPGEPAWAQLEHDWLEPVLADLAAGRLERVELSLAHSSHRLRPRSVRRFWRRARPWWESVGREEPG